MAGGFAVDLQDVKISAAIIWHPETPPVGLVDLRFTRCAVLDDDLERYSDDDNLLLDGFHYDALSPTSDKSSEGRLAWLRKQQRTPGEFPRQPYEHLARVFRAEGRSSDARAISIALQDDLRRSGILSHRAWLVNWLLGVTIGHGWAPWRVVPWIVAWIAVGAFVFWLASVHGYMEATETGTCAGTFSSAACRRGHSCFQPVLYAIDAFVPFFDMKQWHGWQPTPIKDGVERWGGWFYVLYLWLHVALGWVLTTLAVLGLTGIVKKE